MSFNPKIYNALNKIEQNNFWHTGRKEIILSMLKRNVINLSKAKMLEVGCGNGNVLLYLKKNGINIEGSDVFAEGLTNCRLKDNDVNLYQENLFNLSLHRKFSIIGAFDVLEHIEDDDKAIQIVNQALVDYGTFILTVPANMLLWSYFDNYSCHKRRYSKKEIITKLKNNGFTIRQVSYFMFFLFPVLLVYRTVNNIFNRQVQTEQATIPMLNSIFKITLRLENWLMQYISLPFGSSLIVLAEKTKDKNESDKT